MILLGAFCSLASLKSLANTMAFPTFFASPATKIHQIKKHVLFYSHPLVSIERIILVDPNAIAHINLDLGVAAGTLMHGKNLDDLEEDFRLVNDILQEIIEELQERVSRVSPLFHLADRFGRQRDEHLLDFSMRAAREQAWVVAHQVWSADENRAEVVSRIDHNVAAFGAFLHRPKTRMGRWAWRALTMAEGRNVKGNIERLRIG